ncbi:uncharacterized protein LOC125521971 isoform X2 [Triticum urartu]|uniref:uncharacterized protein LOC125521971 isoform X2 n=1 Tax=Triticum urartu TaxID=4572 RepID=UPI0020435F37|nr:uncharacterized protein LOC125521971 isoform X2 [Triticum urartu]
MLLCSFCGDVAAPDYHATAAGHGGQYPYYSYGGGADALCRCGRPATMTVPTEEGFFDDIFGARARQLRSRSRSKSTKSSSVISFDEFGSGRSAFRSVTTSGGAVKLLSPPSRPSSGEPDVRFHFLVERCARAPSISSKTQCLSSYTAGLNRTVCRASSWY